MVGEEQQDMRGKLFRNEKKASEKHPDYSGSITVDGKYFWISGWIETSKGGKKYMSLSVTPKDKSQSRSNDRRDDRRDDRRRDDDREQRDRRPSRNEWDEKLGGDDVPF